MARPKKNIDPVAVMRLAALSCTVAEIASVVKCDKRTLERRFAAEIEAGRNSGKTRLRRLQWRSAGKGSDKMLIWLGKQLLGQRDRQEIFNYNLDECSDEQLERIASGEDPTTVVGAATSQGAAPPSPEAE